jgi:hypothetical protein
MRIPLIGCHAHLANLAIKAYFEQFTPLIDKVQALCVKLKTNTRYSKYLADLNAIPVVSSTIRWRSMYSMLKSYLKFRPYIKEDDYTIACFLLTSAEHDAVIRLIFEYNSGISAALEELDRRHVTLGDARYILDGLAANPLYAAAMASEIGPDASHLTDEGKLLSSAAAKIAAGKAHALTAQELQQCEHFRVPRAATIAPPLPGIVSLPQPIDMTWVPATSCQVERLFSVLKNLFTFQRTSLKYGNLEHQIFARALSSGLCGSFVTNPMRSEDIELAEALRKLAIELAQ